MATRARDRVIVVAPGMEDADGADGGRRSKSRVAMAVLACGVVAAAVGWGANAWLGIEATSEATSEDTGEAVQNDKPPFSAAIKGLPNAMSTSRAVEGDAWLDRSNELEWWLDFLPANSFGLVKLHSGKSCDIVGELHWDGVTTPGPWEYLNWTSNKWGESFGKVNLDDLPGTYSFAANLERALVVYSETGSPLACGVLAPWEHYADFGVELKVGRGFKSWRSNTGTAGQAILGKNNTLTWALFNLEPNSGGAVSILHGKDCTDTTQKWFSLWWASNEWGVAKDSVLLDQPFYQVVDHAVAIFGSSGNLLSCEPLATFVGTVKTRVEDVLDKLVKVEVSHSGASTQKPTTRPTTFSPSSVYRIYSAMLSEYPSTEALCKDAGLQYLDTQALFENNQEELSSRAAEFAEAVAAVQSSTATPYQVKVNNWFIRLKMEQANYLADQSRLSSLTSQWCNYCATRNDTIKEYEQISAQATVQASELQTSYDAIVSISEEVRTAEQKANISEYQRLTTLLNYCEDVIDEATTEYVESCRSYDTCHNSDPLLENEICERFFCLKQEVEIGLLAVSLTEVRKILFNEREQFNAALAATQAGTATLADDARVQRYNTLVANKTQAEAEIAVLKRNLQNDVTCTTPQGTLTLEASNIIQWFLSNLSLESTGSIQIFEGQDCRSIETPLRVGTVTNPSGITWKTQPNATISTGLEDLSLVPENPSFQEISAHSLAVLYNSFGQPIACAPFTVLS